MCNGCFWGHWASRGMEPVDYAIRADPERMALIPEAAKAIAATPTASGEIGDGNFWQGGFMHVQIDDDNYDCDADPTPFTKWVDGELIPMTMAERIACINAASLWNHLDEDERSLVVAMIHGYSTAPPDGWRPYAEDHE